MADVLEFGASGADVTALQQALAAAGFSPGAADGDFGMGTQAAVLAFQQSEGLGADGIVGPLTAAALGLQNVPPLRSSIAQVTTGIVSQMFPQTPIGNIAANLPFVLGAMQTAGLVDRDMILMALATIRAETASFEPISEGQSRYNTSPSGSPFDLYDNRRDLGNQGPPDGANFRGRGFVQLTGRTNYARYGAEIGQDLVNNPQLANQPGIAAQLLADFLQDRQAAIRTALFQNDLATARKLVNGGSHGLDDFEDAFDTGNDLIG